MSNMQPEQRLARALRRLPANLRDQLKANAQQAVVKCDPYFSKIRIPITTVAVASGTYTFTVPAGKFTCFDYGQGDPMTNAGFPSTYTGTYSDTNLLTKSETIGNEFVFVDGVTLMLMPRTETDVLRKVWSELYCSISMEGKANFIRLGNPSLLGGGGGLVSNGQSLIRTPNNQDVRSVAEGFPSNGFASVMDYKDLDDALVWGPKGQVDSQLVFQIDVNRTVTWTSASRAVDLANNITAFTPPAAQTAVSDVDGTFIEAMVFLHSVQIGGRSTNR